MAGDYFLFHEGHDENQRGEKFGRRGLVNISMRWIMDNEKSKTASVY
jgi:hypothetical protein